MLNYHHHTFYLGILLYSKTCYIEEIISSQAQEKYIKYIPKFIFKEYVDILYLRFLIQAEF